MVSRPPARTHATRLLLLPAIARLPPPRLNTLAWLGRSFIGPGSVHPHHDQFNPFIAELSFAAKFATIPSSQFNSLEP